MLSDIKTILYSTDLKGDGREKAYKMAIGLAKNAGARVIVLHAFETSTQLPAVFENVLSDEMLERFKSVGLEERKAELLERIQQYCEREFPGEDYPGGEPTVLVREGKPQRVILEVAEQQQVDMIVMGTRTHTSLGDGLLGSTATKVIHRSKIPVLIYPL
ncbi:MAG: universal stress protein [Gammaproteobacteria bacterium]|nr:universal stress protein [Gammaproteobacteria bacterium]